MSSGAKRECFYDRDLQRAPTVKDGLVLHAGAPINDDFRIDFSVRSRHPSVVNVEDREDSHLRARSQVNGQFPSRRKGTAEAPHTRRRGFAGKERPAVARATRNVIHLPIGTACETKREAKCLWQNRART
jgi:hypothetical protein